MKHFYHIILLILLVEVSGHAQSGKLIEGSVSYVTSKSVYVRFQTTEGILSGDTLYSRQGGRHLPVLVVSNLSSISCVCVPLNDTKLNVSDVIYAKDKVAENDVNSKQILSDTILKKEVAGDSVNIISERKNSVNQSTGGEISGNRLSVVVSKPADSISAKASRVQQIKGRVSIASYSNLSNSPSGNMQKMRYSFLLNAKNINGSRFTAESYVSFVHNDKEWSEIQSNVFKGLKIYNLALSYDLTDNLKVLAGRKINPRLSNMGAVDGIQFEFKSRSITTGLLVGSRPNTVDYSFNTGLFQYGMFISHERNVNRGIMQTTVAFVNQKNASFTDRRFTYIQHSNSAINNLYFFGSAEFDLYRFVNETQDNSPRLSNLYLSLRYRILSNLSMSLSYSSRTNIIYYETYKSFLERLLETEKQQGYMGQINYRPFNKLSVGANVGYRNRKNDPQASRNAYIYANYSSLPLIQASTTISATLLETSYLSAKVYSLGVSRDLLKNKVNSTFTYRYQNYKYAHSESGVIQHTGEIGLNWNIIKKLSLSVNYEGTIDKVYTFNRVYVQLIKRFSK